MKYMVQLQKSKCPKDSPNTCKVDYWKKTSRFKLKVISKTFKQEKNNSKCAKYKRKLQRFNLNHKEDQILLEQALEIRIKCD